MGYLHRVVVEQGNGIIAFMNDIDGKFAVVLDVTGHMCPIPVLRARRVLDDMKTGEMLLVIASDQATVRDIPAFCNMTGHTLHMARTEEDNFLFEIEKGDDAEQRPSAEIIPIRQDT